MEKKTLKGRLDFSDDHTVIRGRLIMCFIYDHAS